MLVMNFKVMDFVRVMYPYEVVYSAESWWYMGLNSHGALWRNCKNPETTVENAKDPFNDVSSGCMSEIIEFFCI